MTELDTIIKLNIDGKLIIASRRAAIRYVLNSEKFMKNLYVDANGNQLDQAKRDELGQFYTPGHICIKMIEKFGWDSLVGKTILDPTVGSGNLLIACLIAGADSDKVFGNEYDADVIPTCRARLNKVCDILGKPHIQDYQVHQGNALHKFALTEFGDDYYKLYFGDHNVEDLDSCTDPEWLNKPDEKKKTTKGWRTRRLNDPNYNAYLSKAYKEYNKEQAALEEQKQLKENNLDALNAVDNNARQANKDKNKAESDNSLVSQYKDQEKLFDF